MKVPIIASKAFSYGGRQLKVGDQFEASQRDARILTGIGRATYGTRDMVAASPRQGNTNPSSPSSPGDANNPVPVEQESERTRRRRARRQDASQRVVEAVGTAEGQSGEVVTPEQPLTAAHGLNEDQLKPTDGEQ